MLYFTQKGRKMIVKIQDDNGQDKHIIEAARFTWDYSTKDDGFFVLNYHDSQHHTRSICVQPGDRVFFMNDLGQTVDSRRIEEMNK